MQIIQQGYNGLSLLLQLNWDRILMVGTIVLTLALTIVFTTP
ncbi:MAG: hypothetical protein VX083_15440 [Pseudomonadota bacterium]|jgi:hypothetical protein|uniref:Uncharacterized protein n=1 Tax=Thalassovita autumnalis TaxID=2072972 RepID=A0A0P1FVX7_9RHOB|nr:MULTISPECIES: hypothetical protein [Thalassovita]MEC8042021.1 hypothetical protein [Pseudomonadota bacterium]MEC8294884.1 hypothetical protein [Pseudomonadota bacterium]CUH69491.1 hypothetical protein TL5118_03454 [Thalassovita autumnalis]CUH72894.1 hypothetical protein TL5120_02694 [Thalassovita autumnalis]|tara:strand:- start:546 stop:671 length:126 start_codon:yes stop_codon:yes gene_type:complete